MKKKYITLFSVVCCVLLLASYTVVKKTSGAHPGSTGAPGDLTCAQQGCHTGAQVVPNAVFNNTLTFSSVDSSYVPGQVYTMTVEVQGPAFDPSSKFGFELVALKDADSMNVGQFVITDNVRTQLIDHPGPNANLRFSVTHQAAGTPELSPNYNRWVFNWTAPPVNEGNITFWYATNCTNNNNLSSGDKIFLHSFKIHPVPLASVKEVSQEYDLKIFYDQDTKEIVVNYDLKGRRSVQLAVYDAAGKQVYAGPTEKQSGQQKHKISLGNDYSKGTYLARLLINGRNVSKKIVIH
jgi:hypothetical protein